MRHLEEHGVGRIAALHEMTRRYVEHARTWCPGARLARAMTRKPGAWEIDCEVLPHCSGVIVHPLIICALCRACRSGDDVHCEESSVPGQRHQRRVCRGAVTLHTAKIQLDDFQSAIDDLDAGNVRGRAILIPQSGGKHLPSPAIAELTAGRYARSGSDAIGRVDRSRDPHHRR